MRMTIAIAVANYAVGVAHSSWKHYFIRYSDEEDRINHGLITEVKLIESKKEKSRGRKK